MKFSTLEVLALVAVVVCVAMKYRRRKAVQRADAQIVRGPRGSIAGLSGAAPADPLPAPPATFSVDGPVLMSSEPNMSVIG